MSDGDWGHLPEVAFWAAAALAAYGVIAVAVWTSGAL